MEKYPLPKRFIRLKGVFEFPGMYKYMRTWMEERHYEFHEAKFKEKPKGHFAPDKEIKWWAKKKLTDYIMFRIEVFIHLWNAEHIEVVKDGKKVEMVNGRMQIEIEGVIITDYANEFEKSLFYKKLENFLNRRIIRNEILLKYWDSFDYELYAFENDIKKFLDMEARETAYGVPHPF
jgi:hypothetical protein